MATATAVEDEDRLRCSFCAKAHTEIERLVAGPGVYICNECVALCNEVIGQTRDEEGSSEPRLPEWKDLDDDAMLGHIANIATTAERIDETLKAWVTELRRRRVTWARIGEALGVTRQSAWERFSVATGEE